MSGWAALAQAGMDLTSAGLNFYGQHESNMINKEVAKQNLAFQREYLDYQKQLQQQMFDREDTAVQRRRADLLAAGLSPVLAAGSSAGAGSVVPIMPAQNQYVQQQSPYSAMAPSLSSMFQNFLNSRKTGQEIDYLQKQASSVRANMKYLELTGSKVLAEVSNLRANTTALNQAIKYGESIGVPSSAPKEMQVIGGLLHIWRNVANKTLTPFAAYLSELFPGIAGDAIKGISNFIRDLDDRIFGQMKGNTDKLPIPDYDSMYIDDSGNIHYGFRSKDGSFTRESSSPFSR